jgi:hypothetical protein
LKKSIKEINNPHIKVIVDAMNFDGWEIHAAIDDMKFGLKHIDEFVKIAFVGDKKWEKYAIIVSSIFMTCDMKYFENYNDALFWIEQEDIVLDTIEKEFIDRKDDIEKSLVSLFETNMKITGWDIPEADDQKAAQILINILSNKLDQIKKDVKNGKY